MRLVIQRVSSAQVHVDKKVIGEIGSGMLVFMGVGKEDTNLIADYFAEKLSELRIFEDAQGKMNLSAGQAGAEFLVVSQFTLYGDCRQGRRPSFDEAAPPQSAEKIYEYFVEMLRQKGHKVKTGQFRAKMEVSLVNDGPVTFILEENESSSAV